jgi:epoxyqueuosine reductase QueG
MEEMDREQQEQLTTEFKSYAAELDIDLIGIAGLDEMNKHGTVGRRPVDLWPEAKAIVVMAIGRPDPYTQVWTGPGGRSYTFSLVIGEIWKLKLVKHLRTRGYRSYGYQNLRGQFNVHLRQARAFEQAGLGYIGKSNAAITEKYGPRVNLETFLTDAPLIPDEPYTKNLCGNCDVCQTHCTSGAIMGDNYFYARLCESVVNCRPEAAMYFSLTSFLDCDMCLRVCPRGEYKWPAEDRRGMWWDHVRKNRESSLFTERSYFLEELRKEGQNE